MAAGGSRDEGWGSLSEVVRSYIAIFVVTFGLLFLLIAWAARGIEDAERVATIIAGILGLVIGYYFGKEGVDKAREDAEKAEREAGQASQMRAIAESVAVETDEEVRPALKAHAETIAEYAQLLGELQKDPNRKVKDALEAFYGK